jgi:CheY-like chemotaxis protein
VIALTATSSDINRQQCLNAGMDDFMSKPYTKEELATVLGRWSGRQQALTAPAA